MRYLTTAGCTNECFLDIQNVPDETAEVVVLSPLLKAEGLTSPKLFGWPLMELAIYLVIYLSLGLNEE